MTRSSKVFFFCAMLLGCACSHADAEPIFFLCEGYDSFGSETNSFVLPLSQPNHIAHARDLIARGPIVNGEPNQPIPVLKVAAGKDGINRDHLSPNKREWSWHVGTFGGFSDGVVPETSATAIRIENDVQAWIAYIEVNGGWTSFALYTVVAELGPALSLTVSTNQQGLTFTWPEISTNAVYTIQGTNLVYTLEQKDSLSSTNWMPVPDGDWPMKTNQWSILGAGQPSVFYRVKAEVASP